MSSASVINYSNTDTVCNPRYKKYWNQKEKRTVKGPMLVCKHCNFAATSFANTEQTKIYCYKCYKTTIVPEQALQEYKEFIQKREEYVKKKEQAYQEYKEYLQTCKGYSTK